MVLAWQGNGGRRTWRQNCCRRSRRNGAAAVARQSLRSRIATSDRVKSERSIRHGKVRCESQKRSRQGDAQEEKRETQERQIEEESHQQKAGDRHWPFESPQKRGEGSAEEEGKEE